MPPVSLAVRLASAALAVRLACALLIAASFGLVAPSGPALAQTSIVATVNGQPITSYDVSQRERLLRLTGGSGGLRDKALEELIGEKLQVRAARAAGIEAPKSDIDDAIASIATRVKLSPAQLAQALGQTGISIEALRDRLAAQIAFGRLVRARFQQTAQLSEQELLHALVKDPEREKVIDSFEYTLEQVIVALPPSPTPQKLAAAKAVAEGVRGKFSSCAEGLAMAKSTRNVVVRGLGRRFDAEMSDETRAALKDTAVGSLTAPLTSPRGLTMFAVCEKKPIRSVNAAMKELEPTLTSERGEAFSKQFLRQLRRDAVIERF